MANNLDVESMKRYLIIIFVLIVFVSVVGKAYEYLDNSNVENNTQSAQKTFSKDYLDALKKTKIQPIEHKQEDLNNDSLNKNESNNKKFEIDLSSDIDFTPVKENILPNSLPIIENPNVKLDDLQLIDDKINSNGDKEELWDSSIRRRFTLAEQKANNKEYSEAIKIYNDIALDEQATNGAIAKSYDAIARVYVIDRKYGLASKYAQKAYEAKPNATREQYLLKFKYKNNSN